MDQLQKQVEEEIISSIVTKHVRPAITKNFKDGVSYQFRIDKDQFSLSGLVENNSSLAGKTYSLRTSFSPNKRISDDGASKSYSSGDFFRGELQIERNEIIARQFSRNGYSEDEYMICLFMLQNLTDESEKPLVKIAEIPAPNTILKAS